MHIQPIDNSTDLEPFVHAMAQEPAPRYDDGAVAASSGDTFDDVWGASEPSSPTVPPTTTGHDAAAPAASSSHTHPSDMPRLQAEHTTAGYREGVTAAKNQSIQAGFDEGFSLGAAIGTKAGQLLGVLEGIANALAGQDAAAAKQEAAETLRNAKEELQMERLFGPDFWNADGTWKYDVSGHPASQGDGHDHGHDHESADDGIIFADVADAHPVIAKWTGIVRERCERWGIDRDVFADEGDVERQSVQEKTTITAGATAPRTKKPLDW